jgi:hypothetical protein
MKRFALAFGLVFAGVAAAAMPSLVDVTSASLPAAVLSGRSMHAAAVDIDHDGDLDIIVAMEFQPNLLLINDGAGRFEPSLALGPAVHDSEEVVAADFNNDGFVDLFFASEDDRIHQLHFGDGAGGFADMSSRIPIRSVANGAAAFDVNADGWIDLILANNGQNSILINDGAGGFRDETALRLPLVSDISQDVEIGDVNGDGHLDLVFANEGDNALLINDGVGVFVNVGGLPSGRPTESRKAALADVDGDGDLDLFFANVALFMADVDPRNQLYLNDGSGRFTEVTDTYLPLDRDSSFEGKFVDVDKDGDLDILTGNSSSISGPGDAAVGLYLNDGGGRFAEAASELPPTARGNVFGIVAADFDRDGATDLYLALRYGEDRLFLRR